jgi:hypothetical protein
VRRGIRRLGAGVKGAAPRVASTPAYRELAWWVHVLKRLLQPLAGFVSRLVNPNICSACSLTGVEEQGIAMGMVSGLVSKEIKTQVTIRRSLWLFLRSSVARSCWSAKRRQTKKRISVLTWGDHRGPLGHAPHYPVIAGALRFHSSAG